MKTAMEELRGLVERWRTEIHELLSDFLDEATGSLPRLEAEHQAAISDAEWRGARWVAGEFGIAGRFENPQANLRDEIRESYRRQESEREKATDDLVEIWKRDMQAAVEATREECAIVCEEVAAQRGELEEDEAEVWVEEVCARRIRSRGSADALKEIVNAAREEGYKQGYNARAEAERVDVRGSAEDRTVLCSKCGTPVVFLLTNMRERLAEERSKRDVVWSDALCDAFGGLFSFSDDEGGIARSVKIYVDNLLEAERKRGRSEWIAERTAVLSAHRACIGAEHDPEHGKIHGYCVVCGVVWPCEYAGNPPSIAELEGK
jgi:hypothetical protein